MKQLQYLDAAKKKLQISSDYALAPHLGMTRQAVSKLRRGVIIMSNTTAAKLAEILELDLVKVIADLELERGSNEELWKRIARKVAAIAAISSIGAGASPSPADAHGTRLEASSPGVYYVKSKS